MQYRHHLQLTHSLVLTFATSLPLRILRNRQRLPPSILEGQLTTLSRISSASVARLHHTLGTRCLPILQIRHIKTPHTPHPHQRHLVTPILLRLIPILQEARKHCTINDRFQPTFRRQTYRTLPTPQSLIRKRHLQ